MKLVIDAHTLVWLLFASNKLSLRAKETILNSEVVFIPTIVILEALHVSQKLGFKSQFVKFLSKLPTPSLQVLPLNLDVINTYTALENKLEIHDRIIVATAKLHNLPIVTKDELMTKTYHSVIW